MPAIDQCEPQVIRAFGKADWTVIQQPVSIPLRPGYVHADLRLQHQQRQTNIIVVEVKCFPESRSVRDEFYHAIGQYLFYRALLKARGDSSDLYLTVPHEVYQRFFMDNLIQSILEDDKIQVVVVNLADEEITQWVTW